MAGHLLVTIACVVFCIVAFIYFRGFIERRTSFDGILQEVRDEVSRLLQRIDETTDNDISLIEDREKRLKTLLEETDRRMAALNRELSRRENAEEAYRKMGRFNVIEQALPPEAAPPVQEAPPVEEPPIPVKAPPAPSKEEQSQEDQIRELVRSGFSPQVIASSLKISISEAELAVALQERRDS